MSDAPPSQLARRIDAWLSEQLSRAQNSPVLFISGAQGAGKSTALAEIAKRRPEVVVLGIDDFYLPAAARAALARDVHPLCATRGPAGTHDLPLLLQVLEHLTGGSGPVSVPVFEKARDDRAPESAWRKIEGWPSAVIVEGWLMGAAPDPSASAAPPLNAVEAEDDRGVWRAWQEAHLANAYAMLWDRADAFLHIDAPSFDTVLAWRIQQEETTLGLAPGTLPPEREAWVARFIQHYERVTRRMLSGLRRRGAKIAVDQNRTPSPF